MHAREKDGLIPVVGGHETGERATELRYDTDLETRPEIRLDGVISLPYSSL